MRNWNGFFGVSVLVGLLVFAAIEWQTPSHAASSWYTVSGDQEAVSAYRPATLENQMADRMAALERRVGELELQLARLQPKAEAKPEPKPAVVDSWQTPTVVDVYPAVQSGQVFESTTMTTTTRQTCSGGQCAARATGPVRRLFGR
jgi:hypothetical protein